MEPFCGRRGLIGADGRVPLLEEQLSRKVARFDPIGIDQAQVAEARAGQGVGYGRTEGADADDGRAGPG